MAATSRPLSPHHKFFGLSSCSRYGAPFPIRISTRSHTGVSAADPSLSPQGPSCIFVGPIETASQETLEALYLQARDAYYSGTPLIVDDMFDRVELKLRWFGSKSVIKYPRCSLRRQSAYSDTQDDPSQVFTLAGVWILILAFGSSAFLVPVLYTVSQAYQDAFGALFMLLGSVVGYPIASASVKALQGLWRNDLVALKGSCPNCGEEVFAFVRSNQCNSSPHRTSCHVCECVLEFRTKFEKFSKLGRQWVHGRVYLVSQRKTRRSRR